MSVVATYALAALVAVAAVQALLIVRLSKALQGVGRFAERLAHLAAALELLTDTTEVGLANVAAELERTSTARPPRPTRGATARRIASAVRRGHTIEDVAAHEALSQGEVRLHLQLAPPDALKGEGHGSMRS